MTNLIAAAVAFLLLHLVVSGTRVRDGIIAAVGAGAYRGLFSVVSLLLLIWLGIAYGGVWHDTGDKIVWQYKDTVLTVMRYVQLVIQAIALLFVVPGLTTRNPTMLGGESALDGPEPVQGILRVTRHPFLWGVIVWAVGHLLVNGDLAAIILFGTMLILALAGTVSIDRKRERALGEKWNAFAAKTSNVPFAAIAGGRQTFDMAEIGWVRILAALIIWAIVLGAHPHIFGAAALP